MQSNHNTDGIPTITKRLACKKHIRQGTNSDGYTAKSYENVCLIKQDEVWTPSDRVIATVNQILIFFTSEFKT